MSDLVHGSLVHRLDAANVFLGQAYGVHRLPAKARELILAAQEHTRECVITLNGLREPFPAQDAQEDNG